MKRSLIFISILGIFFVSLFLWGFYGFVKYGSSGSPPDSQVTAFFAGGILYLILLIAIKNKYSKSHELSRVQFSNSIKENLKLTLIALTICIPAAFIFIGLIIPPFIYLISIGHLITAVVSTINKNA